MLDFLSHSHRRSALMSQQARPYTAEVTATSALARGIRHVAQTDGDYNTAIPALTLHRRNARTEPLHCIYNLGLGVVAQGSKQILLGDESNRLRPGTIHADDHRSPCRLACHAGQCPGAVSWHDADAGR